MIPQERNKLEQPYFLSYKERLGLYRSRCDFYNENPDLPFSALDKLGVLVSGRWSKTDLALSIYSVHQCLNDCDTPEERAETISAARVVVNGQMLEFSRDEVLLHGAVGLFFGALGYFAGYIAGILTGMFG